MPRVVISSGHTADSPGTKANGLVEYEVARKIAKATLPYLRGNGIITLSVPPNLELIQRMEWINKTGYDKNTNDLALEIHINDGGEEGVECWYEAEGNNDSQRLSTLLVNSVCEETKLKNRGAKSEYDHEFGSIAFVNETNPIGALIECGFIDNASDAKFLSSDENIEKIAKGIAKGVMQYYNLPFREVPAAARPVQTAGKAVTPIVPSPAASQPPAPRNETRPEDEQWKEQPAAPMSFTPPPPAPQSGFNSSFNNSFAPSAPMGGMNNFNQPGGFNQTGGFNQNMGGNFGAAPMMSRDERKEMISKHYVKILGREPNQNDLNYFLNIGIKEDELLKKMVDSQEHADLVKARQEVIEIKEKFQKQQSEVDQFKSLARDQKVIIGNLQSLLAQKNSALARLHSERGVMPKATSASSAPPAPPPNYQGSFLDKLFKVFSDLFD